MPIPVIGNGKNFFQFISAKDCAKATLLACEKNFPSETFNLGSKKIYKIDELLKKLISKVKSISFLIPINKFLINLILEILNCLKISPIDRENNIKLQVKMLYYPHLKFIKS